METSAQPEIRDVQDLRQNVKQVKNKNKFKKSLLGYDVKETDSYLKTLEINKDLEKNAFLERIKELETEIKAISIQKEEWETSLVQKDEKITQLEQDLAEKTSEGTHLTAQVSECRSLILECEEELKKREDAVVFLENENLKKQLTQLTQERNDYVTKLETMKNENSILQKKSQDFEEESKRLTENLAKQNEIHRQETLDLSLHISKLVENNRFFCDKTIQGLESLLFSNRKYKNETEEIIGDLKEKIVL